MEIKTKLSSKKIFFIIISSFLIGMYFFVSGFFLVRYQTEMRSLSTEKVKTEEFNETIRRENGKLFFLMIDALKFDFIVPENNSSYKFERFSLLENLLNKEPQNTILIKTIADPPTVTYLRIKSLMTGNLPSFIDLTKNFHAPKVNEDNIIHQLRQKGKKIFFTGDDTWVNLFPNMFEFPFGYESFNTLDLDSEDLKVKDDIQKAMKIKGKWDVLIAHFLGVDHAGHTYDSQHKEIGRKIRETEQIIESVIKEMGNNDTLLIFGDHGMTLDGNHGGSSQEEIETVIFAYSKKGFNHCESKFPELYAFDREFRKSKSQITFTSTISMMVGIPIPFSNLGFPLPDFLFKNDLDCDDVLMKYNEHLVQSLRQVSAYLSEMQEKHNIFSGREFRNITKMVESLLSGGSNEISEVYHHCEMIIWFINENYEKIKFNYATYDMKSIILGVSILVSSAFLLVVIALSFQFLQHKYISLDQIILSFNIPEYLIVFSAIFTISDFQFFDAFGIFLSYFNLVISMQWIWRIIQSQKPSRSDFTYDIGDEIFGYLILVLFHGSHGHAQHSVIVSRYLDHEKFICLTLVAIINILRTLRNKKIIHSLYQILAITIWYVSFSLDEIKIGKVLSMINKFTENRNEDFHYFPRVLKPWITSSSFELLFSPLSLLLILFILVKREKFRGKLHLVLISFLSIAYKSLEIMFKKTELLFLPKIIYIYVICYFILNFKNLKVAQFYYILISLLTLFTEDHSCLLVLLFILSMEIVFQTFPLNSKVIPFTITSIAYFYWNMTSHRSVIPALQISSAYVGFQKFNFLVSGALLTFNTFGVFFVAYNRIYKYFEENEFPNQTIIEWNLIILSALLNKPLNTSINCLYNIKHLLIFEDFAPNLLFDYYKLILLLILIFFLQYLISRNKRNTEEKMEKKNY